MSDKLKILKAYESGLFTQKEIAEKINKSQSYVSNIITEVKKDEEILELKKKLEDRERELDFIKVQRESLKNELILTRFLIEGTKAYEEKIKSIENKNIDELEIID